MNRLDFIHAIAPMAIRDYTRSGVLPSITIAQAILESADGRSSLSLPPHNNLFGIKGTGAMFETREYKNGAWVIEKDAFKGYSSWEASIADHSAFLKENSRYSKAGFFLACALARYVAAAQALQTAGYATDPNYATKLISLIEIHHLAVYDQHGRDAVMEEWKQKIVDDALKQGLITQNHNPNDPAPKWFVLQVVQNSLKQK